MLADILSWFVGADNNEIEVHYAVAPARIVKTGGPCLRALKPKAAPEVDVYHTDDLADQALVDHNIAADHMDVE